MFTGKTKNIGIIGYPIEHSLSPAMQNAAIKKIGIDYSYIAMPVNPYQLKQAILGLKVLGFKGFNVTIPHKINIIPLLDEIDDHAKMIGAVNTVVIQQGKMIGYNTDSVGFITALEKNNFTVHGKHAILLGAGGAALAVIWGLITSGITSLTIGVRNVNKAKPLITKFENYIKINVLDWSDKSFHLALKSCDLLINATPLGMAPYIEQTPPVEWELITKKTFVCDLIYNPISTKFLNLAKENGNHIMNGEGMLVEQGAAAFKLWTGLPASTEVMQDKLNFCRNIEGF